jgi:hypothetical protein
MTRTDLIGGQVHFNSFGVISNLVTPLTRTSYTQPTGTGTALTTYPDVTLQPLGTVLKVDRALPGMSGMRVPTHEPFWGHQDVVPAFGSVGGTNTGIGTAGYIENPTKNFDSSVNLFNAGYSKTFSTSSNFLTDDLTGYISLGASASETYNSITSGIKTGGADNITNVIVNESGVLYTKGTNQIIKTSGIDKATGTLNKATNTITSINNILTTGSGTKVEGIVPGIGKITNSYNNISTVTETYKNVVGGNITAVTQVSSAVSTVGKAVNTVGRVARSIGKVFGF